MGADERVVVEERKAEEALAEAVGQLAVDFAKANYGLSNPKRAKGRCYIEASKLTMAAAERGIPAALVEAYSLFANHYAVEFDGIVVDPTARQFESGSEYPYIGTRAEWEFDCLRWVGATGFRAGWPLQTRDWA